MQKWLLLMCMLAAALPAHAEYADECRGAADKFAREPGSLKVGEIEFLKNCLSSLQRGIVLGDPPPAPSPQPAPVVVQAECPAIETPQCPKCPAAVVCPKADADGGRSRPREREAPEERRLRPSLPVY